MLCGLVGDLGEPRRPSPNPSYSKKCQYCVARPAVASLLVVVRVAGNEPKAKDKMKKTNKKRSKNYQKCRISKKIGKGFRASRTLTYTSAMSFVRTRASLATGGVELFC